MTGPDVRWVGADAILVEVDGFGDALSLAAHVRSGGRGEATEIVPGARSVLFDGVVEPARLLHLIRAWQPGVIAPPERRVEIPVVYDGPDLEDVAARWACSVDEVVRRHTSLDLVSAFCGFAPGFAYLAGLPPELAVPRLDSPRARVPPGSVAIADTWCGVYPTASPGGWRLLGTTAVTLWDAAAADPALLAPGVRVRFTVA